MRVGVLTTSYPSTTDDPAGHFVRGFAEWLARRVGDVEVLALDDGLDPAARMRAGGLPARLSGLGGLGEAAAIAARLARRTLGRVRDWDAVVSHWLVPCGVVGDLCSRGKRHLGIAHGSDVALLRRLPGGAAFVRRLARRAELVYVADALRVPGAPGRVVRMPGRALDAPGTGRAAARAELGLASESRLVVLFVGRLVRDKGADLLLDALPEGALALVVGDGPELVTLAARDAVRAGRARLFGARFGDELASFYAAADLFVLPSRRDGAPTVLAEAAAAGLPILATAVGGVPQAVDRGELVAPEVPALRAALEAHVRDRARATRREPPAPPPGWDLLGPELWAGPELAVDRRAESRHLEVLTY